MLSFWQGTLLANTVYLAVAVVITSILSVQHGDSVSVKSTIEQ